MIVIQTNHPTNIKITNHFAKGCAASKINIDNYIFNDEDTIASYGILRGTGNIFKKSKNFYYIDHGYLDASSRSFSQGATIIKNYDGYFRVVHNDYIGFSLKNYDNKRLERLKIDFKPKKQNGEYIILSPPTHNNLYDSFITDFFELNNWVEETINTIKKYSDRKILIHNKSSPVPLDLLLEKAWAFVSFQSTAGFKAMLKGVPAYFTYKSLRHINKLEEIESGKIKQDIFKALSYNQWTIKEFDTGEAWEHISKI